MKNAYEGLVALGIFAASLAVQAAVSIDSFQSGSVADSAGDRTLASSFNPGSSDKLVVVLGGEHGFSQNTGGHFNSVTLNGTPLVEAVQESSGYPTAAIFYLDDPATAAGTGDLVVNQANHNGSMFGIYLLSGTEDGVGFTATSTNETVSVNATGVSLVIVGYDNSGPNGGNGAGDVGAVAPLTEDTPYLSVGGGAYYNSFACGHRFATAPSVVTSSWTVDDPLDVTASVAAEFRAVPTRLYAKESFVEADTPIRYRATVGGLPGGGAHPYAGPDLELFANASNTDLRHADLSGIDAFGLEFSTTDLRGADLSAALLQAANGLGADLRNATVTDAKTDGFWFNSLWDGADLSGSNLQGAQLAFAEFGSANLTGVNLKNTYLEFAFLDQATLTGVQSGGITGSNPTLPPGWTYTNGYLIGPGANLTGATLTGINLSTRDLSGTNLTNANLTNVNLTGATLTDTIFTGATGNALVDRINAQATQLANEFTLGEIADLRPGSFLLQVVGGQVSLQLSLERSTNMVDWIDTGLTPEVLLPAPEGIEYFRYAR